LRHSQKIRGCLADERSVCHDWDVLPLGCQPDVDIVNGRDVCEPACTDPDVPLQTRASTPASRRSGASSRATPRVDVGRTPARHHAIC
jgi:hypothetical protein